MVSPLTSWKEQNCYDLLEVSPQTSDEEIRIAYKKLRAVYSPNSPGISALFSSQEREEILIKVEEAYRVLSDPLRRTQYDLMLKGEGGQVVIPRPTSAVPYRHLGPEEVREALGNEETTFSGRSLHRIREYLSLDLDEMARETKIGKNRLKAIEEEDIEALPAPVYLKGFLRTYAKFLGLDPYRVVSEYLEGITPKGYQSG